MVHLRLHSQLIMFQWLRALPIICISLVLDHKVGTRNLRDLYGLQLSLQINLQPLHVLVTKLNRPLPSACTLVHKSTDLLTYNIRLPLLVGAPHHELIE